MSSVRVITWIYPSAVNDENPAVGRLIEAWERFNTRPRSGPRHAHSVSSAQRAKGNRTAMDADLTRRELIRFPDVSAFEHAQVPAGDGARA